MCVCESVVVVVYFLLFAFLLGSVISVVSVIKLYRSVDHLRLVVSASLDTH